MNAINTKAAEIKQDLVQHFPIIIRQLSDGTDAVFLLNTLDNGTNTIEMWPVNETTSTTHSVKLDAYHNTIGMSEEKEANIMQKFAEMHKIPYGLKLRKRLYKQSPHFQHTNRHSVEKNVNHTMRRATDKPEFDKEAYMQKLEVAIHAAVSAALKAVSAEYK